MKSIVVFILCLLFSNIINFSEASNLLRFEEGHLYSSRTLYEKSMKMAQIYPDLIEMEILGYSYDARPIYVLRMSSLGYQDSHIQKKHILVMAGLHARETYNPFVVMKIIEDYINDYYGHIDLEFVNIKEILKENVIHFIPLSNPDGFDIVKFGSKIIRDDLLRGNLEQMLPPPYDRLKGNVRTVDLNRNFENYTLDRENKVWISDEGIKGRLAVVNDSPAYELYHGEYPSSELETQYLQDYMLRYDFRVYLSYHSMGRVIFGNTLRYGQEVGKVVAQYVNLASEVTGYRIPRSSEEWAWGYEGRYALYNTNKPLVTIETIPSKVFPTPSRFYKTEYESFRLNQLPIEFIRLAEEIGYFDYKIYKDNQYVRDMIDPEYAQAIADQIGGEVIFYKGPPDLDYLVKVEAYESYNSFMSLFNNIMLKNNSEGQNEK